MESNTGHGQSSGMESYASETIRALQEINTTAKSLADAVNSMIKSVKNDELARKSGVSLLELRNLMMLTYETNLLSIVGSKVDGKSLDGDKAISRVTETRTVLEKIKPIHHKLKYRIEKLIRAANSKGSVNPDDPLNLKPNPSAFDVDEDEGKPGKEDVDEKEVKKYVPPKVSAVRFEDDSLEEKKRKLLEKAKKRALNSDLIQELRNEFDEAPEEVTEDLVVRRRPNRRELERIRYEEEHMTRVMLSKKDGGGKKTRLEDQLMTMTRLGDDVTRFEDISALDKDEDDVNPSDLFKKKRKVGQKAMKKQALKKKNKFKRKK